MTKTMSAKELYRARLITMHEFATLQWEERLKQWQSTRPQTNEVAHV